MPRNARNTIITPFVHVMCQGINKDYILEKKCEIERYLEILEKNYKKFEVKIVAYCIMNNHVHLLFYTEDINQISEFMRRVNTSYAMYYNKIHNRCGHVFRNRYRAEEIWTRNHLLSCINYIHNNPIKAGMCKEKQNYLYSSYNDYIKKQRFVNDELIKECLKENAITLEEVLKNDYECLDFIEDETASQNKNVTIREFFEENNIELEQLIKDKQMLRKFAIELRKKCKLTQEEIGKTIGVSRIKICRILKE